MDRTTRPGRIWDRERLAAVDRAAAAGGELRHALDRVRDLMVEALDVPVALVTLVEEDRQVFVTHCGLPEPYATTAMTGLTHSFCQIVAEYDEPLIIADAREDPRTLENLAIDDLGVIAYAGVPLRLDGHVVGSVCAIDSRPRPWTGHDVALLERFRDLITTLHDSRSRMSTQTRAQQTASAETEQLARRLQRALLPAPLDPALVDNVHTLYRPGSGRLLLGGDFVDVFRHPNGEIGFVVGDVCGHGPESAAIAITLRSSWTALEPERPDLAGLADRLNQIALQAQPPMATLFCTLLIGRVGRAGQVSCALTAGHPAPIDLATATEIALPIGPPVGVIDHATWQAAEFTPTEHGTLLYTDGLIEGRAAPGSLQRYGADQLCARIAELARGCPPALLAERLVQHATRANGEPLADDVAVLIVQDWTELT